MGRVAEHGHRQQLADGLLLLLGVTPAELA
jgi:hypothetical protein